MLHLLDNPPGPLAVEEDHHKAGKSTESDLITASRKTSEMSSFDFSYSLHSLLSSFVRLREQNPHSPNGEGRKFKRCLRQRLLGFIAKEYQSVTQKEITLPSFFVTVMLPL